MIVYKDILQRFAEGGTWGLACSFDAPDCNPDTIRSAESIKQYVIELCDLIKMRRFQDTQIVYFGDDEKIAGYSMVQLIETSLISGHFSNKNNKAYIDVFSCKPYHPYKVAHFTRQFFESSNIAINIVFRE